MIFFHKYIELPKTFAFNHAQSQLLLDYIRCTHYYVNSTTTQAARRHCSPACSARPNFRYAMTRHLSTLPIASRPSRPQHPCPPNIRSKCVLWSSDVALNDFYRHRRHLLDNHFLLLLLLSLYSQYSRKIRHGPH